MKKKTIAQAYKEGSKKEEKGETAQKEAKEVTKSPQLKKGKVFPINNLKIAPVNDAGMSLSMPSKGKVWSKMTGANKGTKKHTA